MFNIGAMVPILALMIPIIAIVMKHWRDVQNRRMDMMERGVFEGSAQAEQRIQKLEERVQVLERIATDKRLSLAEEIDRLGK